MRAHRRLRRRVLLKRRALAKRRARAKRDPGVAYRGYRCRRDGEAVPELDCGGAAPDARDRATNVRFSLPRTTAPT